MTLRKQFPFSIKLLVSTKQEVYQVMSRNHYVTLLSDISIFVRGSWWGRGKVRICGVVVRYWQTSLIISIQSSGHLEHLFLDHWTRKVRNLARWPPWGLTLQILKFVIVTLFALCFYILHIIKPKFQSQSKEIWNRSTKIKVPKNIRSSKLLGFQKILGLQT